MKQINSVNIVAMNENHIPALVKIERECFQAPWSEKALREELGQGLFLVAEQAGRVVGYAGCQTVIDEGYITNIAVASDFRRQGIGRMLLRKMSDEAKKMRLSFLTLEVRVSNSPAVALYKEMGFKKVGIRKCFYSNPVEDAELWTLNLYC